MFCVDVVERQSGFDLAVVAQLFRAAENAGLKPCATQVEML